MSETLGKCTKKGVLKDISTLIVTTSAEVGSSPCSGGARRRQSSSHRHSIGFVFVSHTPDFHFPITGHVFNPLFPHVFVCVCLFVQVGTFPAGFVRVLFSLVFCDNRYCSHVGTVTCAIFLE